MPASQISSPDAGDPDGSPLPVERSTRPLDEDAPLLRAFAGGDETALGRLAERHEAALLGLAAGLLGGDREAASDVVQDVWVRVIRHAARFAGRSSVRTWLYRITINRCRDANRARRRRRSEIVTEPAVAATRNETGLPRVRQAVATLPEAQREIVLLCYHRGMTHEHVADVLQLPLGTVKSRLHAALKTLRRRLTVEIES